ncbi:MAG: efflux RND transporter periplasmic adaptor subunit [Candidatus Kapabacteria bacterium]|nr:efflux RND transporter periplasmic adaptor subunit [Candidatus Kapabacteria bacterium]
MHSLKAVVSTVLMCFVVGCAKHDEQPEERQQFLVTTPLRTDTTIHREYVCQIRAIQHIELRALERGYLENILVDEGQVVKKGQLMFTIKPTIYEAELRKVQAEARIAELEYLNTKALAEKNIVSSNELALAKARFDRANADVGLAQTHVNFTRIVAPFTGIMDRLQVRQGSLLEEGEMLSALADNSQLWVYFNVPEAEYLEYKSRATSVDGDSVALRMANNSMYPQHGRITAIEADFNNETGNIAFRATFDNPKGLLRHGETGTILMTENMKNVLLIPQKATFEVLDKKFVYVVDAKGVIRTRQIEIQAELPHVYAIKSGLVETDHVLIEGLRKVHDRDTIRMRTIDARTALNTLALEAE